MKIKKNSWHHRIFLSAYKGQPAYYIPTNLSTCEYVATIAVQVLFFRLLDLLLTLAILGAVGWFLYGVVLGCIHHPLVALAFIGAVAAVIGMLLLSVSKTAFRFYAWYGDRKRERYARCSPVTFED